MVKLPVAIKILSRIALCIAFVFCSSQAYAATADDFRTPEYQAMNSLDNINAAQAYALGFTGLGVVVAIIDDGARASHQEFINKSYYPVTYFNIPGSQNHGVHVTGTIGASKDNTGMHGVAFDAELVSLVAIDGTALDEEQTPVLQAISAIQQYPQVRIVSNSWATTDHTIGNLAFYNQWPDMIKEYYSDSLAPAIAEVVDGGDVLFVFGTANNGLPSPSMNAGMISYLLGTELVTDFQKDGNTTIPAADPELGNLLKNNFIGVGAYDPIAMNKWGTGSLAFIAPFSNMADGAEDYIIFAPGVDIYSSCAASDSAYQLMGGTSMATPHVSGAAALVSQAFPYMGGKQLADVILSTATPLQISDVSSFLILAMNNNTYNPHIFTWDATLDASALNGREEELKRLFYAVTDHHPDEGGMVLEMYNFFVNELKDILDDKATRPEFHLLSQDDYMSLFGVGLLDVFKAVRGPGYFNANRLDDAADLSIGQFGGSYAMYRVDSKGFDSIWSNDIGELRNTDPASSLFGLPVGLYKNGDGILYLTGRNTYSGPTVIDGGIISLGHSAYNPASLAGNVWLGRQGGFAGNGLVAGDINSQGVLIPGLLDVPGTIMTVNGHVNHNGGLLVLISHTGDAQVNRLQAMGDISLDGDIIVGDTDGGPITPYQSISSPFVVAGGQLNTGPGYLGRADISAFMSFNVWQQAQSLYMDLHTAPLNTFNNQLPWQTGQMADSLEALYHRLWGSERQRDLDYLYNQRSVAAFAASANQLRGDIHGATMLAPTVNRFFQTEMLHMPAPAKVQIPSAGEDGAPPDKFWIKPVFYYSNFEGNNSIGQSRTEADHFGFVAGMQTHTAINGLSLGVMGGYAHSRFEQQKNDEAQTDDISLAVYGSYNTEPWSMNAYAGAGWQQYDTRRGITTNTGNHRLKSDFDGFMLSGGINAACNLLAEDSAMALRPCIGLSAWHLRQSGRDESGHRTFALDVDSTDLTRLNLDLGLLLEYQGKFSVAAAYRHKIHGMDAGIMAAFSGGNGPQFEITGPEQERGSFIYGLNALINITDEAYFSASVMGEASGSGYEIGGSLGVVYEW